MYADRVIHGYDIDEFAEYIPVNYHSQIELGELNAMAVYEGDKTPDNLLGVTVTADHSGWLEIVWLSVNKEKNLVVRAADLLRYRVSLARLSGKYIGAFSEVHCEEESSIRTRFLLISGFEIKLTDNNIYEFTLEDVTDTKLIEAAATRCTCISIAEAAEYQLYDIEEVMQNDERAIPAPFEMDWDNCEQDLSVICIEQDRPVGLLYFTKEEDYLVLELAYSASPTALPGMLGKAYLKAKEKYPSSQNILVPIVGKGTSDIVTKIVPSAKRGKIEEAVLWFQKPDMPKVMEMLLERVTGKQ